VGWADIPELSTYVGRRPVAWQQCWQQSRRNGAEPRPYLRGLPLGLGCRRVSRWTASELAVGGLQHLSPQVGRVGDRVAVAVGGNSNCLLPDRPIRVVDPALPEAPPRTAGPKRHVRLYLSRGPGLDFSERDRAVLTLLRPHLYQAFLDAERRRNPVPRLTPRQWELLRLVAAGHTNAQIARRLGISERTVRTHLENIYERLHVSSRTAAVTRAFPDHAG
jgi:DNA-binding CsgD family transcriptional regulator